MYNSFSHTIKYILTTKLEKKDMTESDWGPSYQTGTPLVMTLNADELFSFFSIALLFRCIVYLYLFIYLIIYLLLIVFLAQFRSCLSFSLR